MMVRLELLLNSVLLHPAPAAAAAAAVVGCLY
jgi:hypothetical protein